MSIEKILIDLTVALDANTQAITAQTAAGHGIEMLPVSDVPATVVTTVKEWQEAVARGENFLIPEGVVMDLSVGPKELEHPQRLEDAIGDMSRAVKALAGETGNAPETTPAPQDVDGASDVSVNIPDTAMVDKDGIVWDERIHSSSKKQVKSTGKWSRRKNITDELYAQVILELQGNAVDTSSTSDTTVAPVVAPVVAPKTPKVFPEPVDATTPTHAECEDVMAYFSEFHGNKLSKWCLEQWPGLTTLDKLPEAMRGQWVEWMRVQDEDNKC